MEEIIFVRGHFEGGFEGGDGQYVGVEMKLLPFLALP